MRKTPQAPPNIKKPSVQAHWPLGVVMSSKDKIGSDPD